MTPRILVVDDDRAFRIATDALLQDNGYSVTVAASGSEAQKVAGGERFDLVLSDVVMEGVNGIELLQWFKAHDPTVPIMMITGFGSINTAVEAMRLGAYDYITKPCDNEELLIKIKRVLEERRKDIELRRLREQVRAEYSFASMITRNEKMRQIFKLTQQVAETDVTVLILGDTGTGKELLARAIHHHSARKDQPFVVINCSALSETLLESELFGHEKGAFTGAQRQRIGKFEDASGGTVFLDEIGDISPQVQVKLLRVLQEKEIERIGGNRPLPVDVRVIAATNRNLAQMLTQRTFREDLYYRLNVFPLHLPPLRERLDDLPLLIDHFLKKYVEVGAHPVTAISQPVLEAMMKYEWKGNIRELENLLKRAIIQSDGETITSLDIPTMKQGSPRSLSEDLSANGELSFKEYLRRITQEAEHKYLVEMLRRHRGNIKTISELMELDRKTVYKKIDELGIDLSKFRDANPTS